MQSEVVCHHIQTVQPHHIFAHMAHPHSRTRNQSWKREAGSTSIRTGAPPPGAMASLRGRGGSGRFKHRACVQVRAWHVRVCMRRRGMHPRRQWPALRLLMRTTS